MKRREFMTLSSDKRQPTSKRAMTTCREWQLLRRYIVQAVRHDCAV